MSVQLPQGWAEVQFSDAVEKIPLNGKKVKQKDYQEAGKYPVVDQGQRLIGGYTDQDTPILVSYPIIIFGDHTRCLKLIDFDFVPGADGVHSLKPLDFIDPNLLWYFSRAIELPDRGYGRHLQFLMGAKLPIPPLEEQKRIVAKLDTLMTRSRQAREELAHIPKLIERYKQAILTAAFNGRLTAKWRQENGLNLDSWDIQEVASLGIKGEQVILTGPFGADLGKNDFISTGVPVITIGCLTENGIKLNKAQYISEEKADYLGRYKVKENDVLFSRMATVGRAGIVPETLSEAIINYHIMRLRLDWEKVMPKYFYYYVQGGQLVKEHLEKINRGATREGINSKGLASMPVQIPSIEEQQIIIEEIELKLALINHIQAQLEATEKLNERLVQALLEKAFQGELIPQNHDDEPASVLLERIKAQKAAPTPPKAKSQKKTKEKEPSLA